MMTREEKKAKLREELDNIYCYNCKWDDSDETERCDVCYIKHMSWQPSEGLLDWIIDVVMEKTK